MLKVFDYLNYREFIHDYYADRKRDNPSFSYQVFANSAGFKSKSFIRHVVDGAKNLSEQSAQALGRALHLTEKEQAYFETLVAFNQAKSHSQKNSIFSRLMEFRAHSKARVILRDQYEFYSNWYHNTIRELVAVVDFKGDFKSLGRMVRPQISARQARQSVQLLVKLGLLSFEKGRYVQTVASVTTGDEVQSLAVQNFHLQNLNLAGESIDTIPAPQRDISCIVSAMSPECFQQVKSEIQGFRKKLMALISNDRNQQRVYHIAMQLFPTSLSKNEGDADE
jgi:uncharacterized protein (TIGR02147 family)